MKITIQNLVQRNPEMLSGNMDGEIVMMSVQKGEYYGLDKVGSRIWELLETPVRVETMINQLMDEYDTDRGTCENDVLEFLEELQGKGLLIIKE